MHNLSLSPFPLFPRFADPMGMGMGDGEDVLLCGGDGREHASKGASSDLKGYVTIGMANTVLQMSV